MASFFMQSDLRIIPSQPEEKTIVSLKSPKLTKQREFTVEKNELSKNIQKFDRKVKVYTDNPHSYKSVTKTIANNPVPPVKTAEQMIVDKTYNSIGKFLGIDTTRDWNRYYDKVYTITEWAKSKTGYSDVMKILRWIGSRANTIPSLGGKRIDDLYYVAYMQMSK